MSTDRSGRADPPGLSGAATPASDVVRMLAERGATLGVAESLTGGLLAATVTGVPGSSAVFRGGVVAYATDVKTAHLAVPAVLVRSVGVVSAEVAAAMAEGARSLLDATYAVATTGVAGPDLQEGKPAGTVFVAIAGPDGVEAESSRLDGDREQVRHATVLTALGMLGRRLGAAGTPPGP